MCFAYLEVVGSVLTFGVEGIARVEIELGLYRPPLGIKSLVVNFL